MKLRIVFGIGLGLLGLLIPGSMKALALNLQHEIERAEAGAVIVVPQGEYEGAIIIDKPITLRGEQGAVIRNETDSEVLDIQSDHVTVEGLRIVHETKKLDSPAIIVHGHNNTVRNLSIETLGMGIVLDRANENTISDVVIDGPFKDASSAESMSARLGNGIDLFRSHSNVIERVTLRDVQDGIYIEHSKQNVVRENDVSDSRYGFHLMFTEETKLTNNTALGNITGAMVMGTRGTLIADNHFRKQTGHVHSQGIMLYDVQGASVVANELEHNLIGLFIESSSDNRIERNSIHTNYVGLEMHRSQHNMLVDNEFIANVISARAKDSQPNQVENNYWDDHLGFDVDGDQISELPYHADWIFPSIIAKKPAYQIFAGSTGLFFLNQVMGRSAEAAFTDTAPRMAKAQLQLDRSAEKSGKEIIYYSLALLTSTLILYGGRRSCKRR